MAERSIAASTYALDAAGASGYQPGLRPPGTLPLTMLPPPPLLSPVRVHFSALDISIDTAMEATAVASRAASSSVIEKQDPT